MKQLSKSIVQTCFRNTALESHHAGTFPATKTGDYSDVKVVTPYGEISWNELSRISDEEMKALMIQSVNYTYTYLKNMEDQTFTPDQSMREYIAPAKEWNDPEVDVEMDEGLKGIKKTNKERLAYWKEQVRIEDEEERKEKAKRIDKTLEFFENILEGDMTREDRLLLMQKRWEEIEEIIN